MTFRDQHCVECSLKTPKLNFLNILSRASCIRTIRKFDRVVTNNIHIKNTKALNFVKLIICSTFLFVILSTFVVKFKICGQKRNISHRIFNKEMKCYCHAVKHRTD